MLRVLVLLLLSLDLAAAEIALEIEDIIAPNFKLQGVTAKLVGENRLDVKISEVTALDRKWRNVTLSCGKFELDSYHVHCAQGTANIGTPLAPFDKLRAGVNFDYAFDSGKINAELTPSRGEKWRVAGRYQEGGWNFKVAVENGSLKPFAQWLPRTLPKISAGVLNGSFSVAGSATGFNSLSADLALGSLAFSDESGLHAGEKVGGKVQVEARRKANWDWNLDVLWDKGEAFWQPIYLKGEGHRLRARGEVGNSEVEIAEALLTLKDIGDFAFVGRGRDGEITEAGVAAEKITLPRLYEVVLKPFLEKTALNDLRTTGLLDFALRYVNGEITEVNVGLDGVSLEDMKQRFAAFGVDAKVPWNRYSQTSAKIRLGGGEIFRVPLGKIELPVAMRGFSFAIDSLEIPILNGALRLNDFRARRENEAWQWSFSGGVAPISMQELANTLNVTTMRGALSGTIPRVSYERSTIAVEGALLLRVFDGTIEVKDLKLFEPLGIAPTLNANVEMKRLDLDLLTRAYSFGNITGRVDVSVNDLALVNWRPVRFDAKLASSEGSYPRKISQTAVENISALGGASAAAAIQRSVLRFFDRFGYSRLGWSCSLANGVCQMGGIEPAGQGYVIVEGGGVPQITVLGYNRRVNWDELLTRLKRVTTSKPVVQ